MESDIRNRSSNTVDPMRLLIACCLAPAVLAMAIAARPPGGQAARLNMVVVFIDDMGWGDFSCFGNQEAKTPNIDQMAADGIAFEQFYVNSPICSPSRVAISTGTYPQRWNITSFLMTRRANKQRGMADWLDPGAPMVARSLQRAGYATGHFGKWHMGGQHDVANAPAIREYGFDESLSNFEGMGPKLLPLITRKDGTVGRIYPWQHLGPFTWMQRSNITTGFIDAAIPFMEKAKKDGKPFYLNLWPDDVHGPFWPSLARLKQARNSRELYLAVLEELDAQLAKLFDHIKNDVELRGNTIILICSDNGPSRGAGSVGRFKGYKSHLYEGGIRSPLIVWPPGLMPPDRRGTRNTDSVFSAMDLVPSLLALAGVTGEKTPNTMAKMSPKRSLDDPNARVSNRSSSVARPIARAFTDFKTSPTWPCVTANGSCYVTTMVVFRNCTIFQSIPANRKT